MIGIDPGSDTLGVAVLKFDLQTLQIVSSRAWTLNGTRQGRGTWITALHGDRLGRIHSHRHELERIFHMVRPLSIASESPFMSRRMPGAYGALVEVICAVREAALAYDAERPLNMIDPPTVKRAVGVSGKTGGPEGKKLMQQAALAMSETLHYDGDIPFHLLDEHSIDALAVAYCHYLQYLEKLCLIQPKPTLPEASLLQYSPQSGISSTRTIRRRRKMRRSKRK